MDRLCESGREERGYAEPRQEQRSHSRMHEMCSISTLQLDEYHVKVPNQAQ
jgi:hypothetical protein